MSTFATDLGLEHRPRDLCERQDLFLKQLCAPKIGQSNRAVWVLDLGRERRYSGTYFVILSIFSRKSLINSCSKMPYLQVVKGNSNIKITGKTALFINEPVCFEGFNWFSESK